MDAKEAERAYDNEPVFHAVVDAMLGGLMNGYVSTGELRAASILAINRYASHKPPEGIKIDAMYTNLTQVKRLVSAGLMDVAEARKVLGITD